MLEDPRPGIPPATPPRRAGEREGGVAGPTATRAAGRPVEVRAALLDHALDLERHGERADVILLDELHRSPLLRLADGLQDVQDLQLERILLVHEQVLDERLLPVPDR